MNTITFYGGELIFKFKYDKELKDKVKAIHGCRYDSSEIAWKLQLSSLLPKDIENVRRFAENNGFTVTALANDAMDKALLSINDFTKLVESTTSNLDISSVTLKEGIELRDYQKAGVEFLVTTRNSILGYAMRLGKSLTTGVALKYLNAFPVLVVTTASTKLHWEREFSDKLLVSNTHIISGKTPYKLPTADVYIVNHSIVSYHYHNLSKIAFKAMIVDEVHNYGTPSKKSKQKDENGLIIYNRYNAVKELGKAIPIKFGLTGTLFRNNIKELGSVLDVLGLLDKIHSKNMWNFLHEYTNAEHNGYGWKFSGGKNIEKLSSLLKSTGAFLRKTKEDVLKDLPPIQYATIPVELSNREEYEEIESGIRTLLKTNRDKKKCKFNFEASDDFLGTKPEDSGKEVEVISQVIKQLTLLREAAGRGKVDDVCQWIDQFLEETDEKLVVFAHHQTVQKELINTYGSKACSIMASHSIQKREDQIHEFFNNSEKRIIVCSLKAAGEGIDLSMANTVLHTEYWWNPAVMDQASARIEKVGKTAPLNVYYASAARSIDQYSEQIIEEKRRLSAAVNDVKLNESEESLLRFFLGSE